jgi:hypothetical protein
MKSRRWVIPSILCVAMMAAPLFLSAANRPATPPTIESRVRHEILMLPYYNVFDNLEYRVDDGGVVTLSGAVTRDRKSTRLNSSHQCG